MRRVLVTVGLVLMLALVQPGATANWSQYRGSAGHNEAVVLPAGPLDILRLVDLPFWVDPFNAAMAVATPDGLAVMGQAADGCWLVIIGEFADPLVPIPLPVCLPIGSFEAYDAATDSLLVCGYASAPDRPLLVSLARQDLSVRWQITPADAGLDQGAACSGPSLDGDRVVLGVSAYVAPVRAGAIAGLPVVASPDGQGRVIAVEMAQGDVLWRADPASMQRDTLPAGTNLFPYRVVTTDNGYVVSGWVFPCQECSAQYAIPGRQTKADEGFHAWLARDGTLVGVERARSTDLSDAERTPPISLSLSAKGPVAAGAIGGRVVIISPTSSRPLASAPIVGVEPPTANIFWETSAWAHGVILVALPASLAAFSETLTAAWSASSRSEGAIADVVPTATGGFLVADAQPGGESYLQHLDAQTGRARWSLSLDVGVPPAVGDTWYARLVQPEAGKLVILWAEPNQQEGLVTHIALLGEAAPAQRPVVAVRDAFPAVGQAVNLSLPGAAGNVSIDWGDGTSARGDSGDAFTHIYPGRGVYDARVSLHAADGTTATTVKTFDVGGTAPAELSAIQMAFAPQNQDLTFGVLGITVTLLGLLFTFVRTRRRINRLEREMAALEELRIMTAADPLAAARELRAVRERLPQDLARARLSEGHYQLLMDRSARILSLLRARLLAPHEGHLSPGYRRLLDAALEDGEVGPREYVLLTDALEAEQLDANRRDQLREVLDTFRT